MAGDPDPGDKPPVPPDASSGDRYDLSGDFRGAVINIKSTIVSSAEAKDIENLPPEPGDPPFQGMQAFDEKDAARFFGREALIAKIVGRLNSTRFLAIIGASGSGKSSVVRAGVIPALRRGDRLEGGSMPPSNSSEWEIRVFTPTAHPLDALAASLSLEADQASASGNLAGADVVEGLAAGLLEKLARPYLLLVINQFEEIFTQCRRDEERIAFVQSILRIADPTHSQRVTVLLTLRADFYAQLAAYDKLRDLVSQNQEFIGAMTRAELTRAILQPAALGNWKVQEGLVDVMLDDLGDEPGALPLLSHALLETWKRRRGRVMTLSGYVASGGVRGAIAQTAETVFRQKLTPAQQPVARMIFVKLAEMGESSVDTRRRAAFSELLTRSIDPTTIDLVLSILTDARLITTDTIEPGDQRVVEVSHEALIREWPTLRTWLNEDRDGLILHRQLTEDTNDWLKLSRDPGSLYRGARLEQTLKWAAANPDLISVSEQEFLDASRKIAGEEQGRIQSLGRARRVQIALAGAAGVLVIAVVVVLLAANGYLAPRKMNGVFNVAVAEFGEMQPDGQIRSSDLGRQISGWAANYVREQLKGDPNLLVWPHDGKLFNRTHVALVQPETAAAVADDINAGMLLYGYVDRSTQPPQVVVKFYVAPQAKYHFEDIQGSFSVGNPIPVADLSNPGISVRGDLERQAAALAWIGLGVAHEQFGQSADAIDAFQRATDLAPESETTQFFLGREYLFLSDREPQNREKDWQAAEQALQKSISLNDKYARAYVALGALYFKQAAALLDNTSDPAAIAQSQAPAWVQKSIEAYQAAYDLKPDAAAYGNPVEEVALLSLGNAYRLKGVLETSEGDQAAANASLAKAAEMLESVRPKFEQLARDHEAYRRYLAQAYEYLGETYQWQGYVAQVQQDTAAALEGYRKSLEAYSQCIAQGDPKLTSDLIIQNEIVGKFCKPYSQDTQQSYDALSGGP
ncbi:MAG: tetratricopeptide repeat protein [Anaerolineae bacterium]